MPIEERTIRTSHADIAVRESANGKLPVLLIHGGSASKEAFAHQFESALARDFHLIALDLPGHGASSGAFEPAETYTHSGYADAAIEVLETMGIERFVVVGWSLGGHVALEILASCPGVIGVLLTDAPPGESGVGAIDANRPYPDLMLVGRFDVSVEQLSQLQQAIAGDVEDLARNTASQRSGRRVRERVPADGIHAVRDAAEVAAPPLPAFDAFASDYVPSVAYRDLAGETHRSLPRAGCMARAYAPAIYDGLLRRALEMLERRADDVDTHLGLALSA